MNGIKDFKVPQYMDIAHPDRGFFGYLLRCKCLPPEEVFINFIFLDDGNECCKRLSSVKKRRQEIRALEPRSVEQIQRLEELIELSYEVEREIEEWEDDDDEE